LKRRPPRSARSTSRPRAKRESAEPSITSGELASKSSPRNARNDFLRFLTRRTRK
jgi:hypothetical protein